MSPISEFIKKIENELPDAATPQDLVALGLFTSTYAMAQRRMRGEPPEFLNLSRRRILYPKQAVLSWLWARAEKSSISEEYSEAEDVINV